jgi:transposase
MFESPDAVVLTEVEGTELVRRARSRRLRSSDSERAKLVLLLAEGASYALIQERLGCSAVYISRWKHRFLAERLAGLYGRHQGSRATAASQRLEARILSATRTPPPDGSTQWSSRKLAEHLQVSHMRVARA